MSNYMRIITALLLLEFFIIFSPLDTSEWPFGQFIRIDTENPILSPCPESKFYCPLNNKIIQWECAHTFNPAAVVRNGIIYLFYRAEDNYGQGIGMHISRLGLAVSKDGIHFKRYKIPIFYPALDAQSDHEWPGGCEDPRIIEREDGLYVMTYTQWNRKIALLAVATSPDLMHWQKHGYVFEKAQEGSFGRRWSKSGSIVCKREGDRLIAYKIHGKYWMYWGEGNIFLATSNDLISWEPIIDANGFLVSLMEPRPGKFDSALVEPGPPALLVKDGIVLLYNGKNADPPLGDPRIDTHAYSAGQVLLDRNDPKKVIARTEDCFFKPEKPFETKGQYKGGTVFIEGLVHFKGSWFLYYGAADSKVGVAYSPSEN
jgi:predicted GH43/DUF377 family glycosyl hydrolase